jgi:hypothetical protein
MRLRQRLHSKPPHFRCQERGVLFFYYQRTCLKPVSAILGDFFDVLEDGDYAARLPRTGGCGKIWLFNNRSRISHWADLSIPNPMAFQVLAPGFSFAILSFW